MFLPAKPDPNSTGMVAVQRGGGGATSTMGSPLAAKPAHYAVTPTHQILMESPSVRDVMRITERGTVAKE